MAHTTRDLRALSVTGARALGKSTRRSEDQPSVVWIAPRGMAGSGLGAVDVFQYLS